MNGIQSLYSISSLIWSYLPSYPKKTYVIDSNNFFDRQQKCFGMYANKTIDTLAYMTSVVASATLLASDFSVRVLNKVGIRLRSNFLDFHYLYESKIFESYLLQLQNFVQKEWNQHVENHEATSFEKKGHALIQLILNPPQLNDEGAKRQFHQKILTDLRHLRNELQTISPTEKKDVEGMCRFINELCEWIYTQPMIMNEMVEFIKKHLSDKENEQLENASMGELLPLMNQFYQRLRFSSKFQGIDESELRLYDPHFLGDIPSVLFSYLISAPNESEVKKVKIIRTPVITRDLVRNGNGKIEKALIVEEFTGFLESYAKKNKSHVYINLMERSHSEGVRSKLIENLEAEYPQTFHVITLAKNSDFYRQRRAYAALDNGSEFKKNFMKEMFSKNKRNHYHWSPALGSTWEKECKELLDGVHSRYFNDQETLNQKQRLDFIEIAYAEIIDKIFVKLEPDTANLSCKSCIDRGAERLALQYLKANRAQDMNQTHREELVAIILAPAILAMNRVLQNERFTRFSSSASFFLV